MTESNTSHEIIGAPAMATPSTSTSTVTQAPIDDKDRDLEALGEFKYFRAPVAGPSSQSSSVKGEYLLVSLENELTVDYSYRDSDGVL